jgi:nitroimidazol reductase NimA-like FMN-containing flavoprotein (pyridoxamine 5'-phosphate oxidase superfamily)
MALKKTGKEMKKLVGRLPQKPRKLSREELEKEIIQFITKHKICTLATCSGKMPRSTPVRYLNKGMTIYVFAEGGGKLTNLKKNSNISVSLYGTYSGFLSVKGLQLWGKAEIIYQKDKEAFAEANRMWETQGRKDIDRLEARQVPPIMKAIKITVEKARYLNFEKGIINQTWKE